MNKSDLQIIDEIDEKVKAFKSKHGENPKYIMLGNLAYFNLKIHCENTKSVDADWKIKPGENNPYLYSYKKLKIIINSLDQRIGIYKPQHDEVNVLGD